MEKDSPRLHSVIEENLKISYYGRTSFTLFRNPTNLKSMCLGVFRKISDNSNFGSNTSFSRLSESDNFMMAILCSAKLRQGAQWLFINIYFL